MRDTCTGRGLRILYFYLQDRSNLQDHVEKQAAGINARICPITTAQRGFHCRPKDAGEGIYLARLSLMDGIKLSRVWCLLEDSAGEAVN